MALVLGEKYRSVIEPQIDHEDGMAYVEFHSQGEHCAFGCECRVDLKTGLVELPSTLISILEAEDVFNDKMLEESRNAYLNPIWESLYINEHKIMLVREPTMGAEFERRVVSMDQLEFAVMLKPAH